MQKDEATVDAFLRILRQFTAWVAKLPGQGGQFVPSQLTTTAVERYLSALKEQGTALATAPASKRCSTAFASGSFYLGHVTIKGMPAIGTTVRYTQVSRAQVKEKLKLLKG